MEMKPTRSWVMLLALCLPLLMMVGCKIVIAPPAYQGAEISSLSGAYVCTPDSEDCVIEVHDLFFNETFTATAGNGYSFAGWKRNDRALCGGRTKDCPLFTAFFAGFGALIALLESNEEYYIEAAFEPITGDADQFNTVGLWGSVVTDGNCSAEGVVEFWVVPGRGLYTQFRAPNTVTIDPETCETVDVPVTRILGPLALISEPQLTAEEMQTAWGSVQAGSVVTVLDADNWKVERANGVTQILTRLP